MRELVEHVGHLVAALAAAHVHNDLRVRPLGQLVLHDRLAAAEGAGHGRHTALGDGEQGIDDPLTRDHRRGGSHLLLVGTGTTYRPALEHGHLVDVPAVGQSRDRLGDVEVTLGDLVDHAFDPVGYHDLVQDDGGLLDHAQDVARLHGLAHVLDGHEVPQFVVVEIGDLHAADDTVAEALGDLVQRTLDAVEDALDQTGSELHRQGHTRADHLVAHAQSRRLLVDLDGGAIVTQLDDLADQPVFAYLDDVVDLGVGHAFRHDQRSGYFYDFASHYLSSLPNRMSTPKARSICSFIFSSA